MLQYNCNYIPKSLVQKVQKGNSMSNTKSIVFVPQDAEVKTYNLSSNDAEKLLDALKDDCVEVEAGTGVYTVNNLDNVTAAYHHLFVDT